MSTNSTTPLRVVVLVSSMLLFGSINTLTKKAQFRTCGPNVVITADDAGGHGGDCPEGTYPFNKPWTQNLVMFMGEALLLFLFLRHDSSSSGGAMTGTHLSSVATHEEEEGGTRVDRAVDREAEGYLLRNHHQQNTEETLASTTTTTGTDRNTTPRSLVPLLALPALCDVLGTGLSGVGMNWVSASVWQMMRGSIVIFTSLLSIVFLSITVLGLCVVGVSSILDVSATEGHGSRRNAASVGMGIFFVILGQFCSACQMVLEEMFLKKRRVPVSLVVGMEGVWGIGLMMVILLFMFEIPGVDNGSFENVIDSGYKIAQNTLLQILVVSYFLSIALLGRSSGIYMDLPG